jgi:hypothetical protein
MRSEGDLSDLIVAHCHLTTLGKGRQDEGEDGRDRGEGMIVNKPLVSMEEFLSSETPKSPVELALLLILEKDC